MAPPRKHVEFLEKGSYRQRRARDGAKAIPVLAAVLMVFPLMWSRTEPTDSLTSSGMYYLFGLWAILVVLAFVLSKVLTFGSVDERVGSDAHAAQQEREE